MKVNASRFFVRPGRKVNLNKWPTRVEPLYTSKEQYEELLAERVKRLGRLQEVQYADNRYALLVILQAMDAAGKDGILRHVVSGIDPQGVHVSSFKQPNATELDLDFLWRTTLCLPGRGRIGVFNRSYYEEVLVVRVHPEILRGQGLPESCLDERTIWQERFRSIVDFERHLHRNGTRLVKIFLHVSKEEQARRLVARIDERDKNWKFSVTDVRERGLWKQYMAAYEQCLSATSRPRAPWYVVPADDKWNARLIAAEAIIEALASLRLAIRRSRRRNGESCSEFGDT